jgi:hypothetical protein
MRMQHWTMILLSWLGCKAIFSYTSNSCSFVILVRVFSNRPMDTLVGLTRVLRWVWNLMCTSLEHTRNSSASIREFLREWFSEGVFFENLGAEGTKKVPCCWMRRAPHNRLHQWLFECLNLVVELVVGKPLVVFSSGHQSFSVSMNSILKVSNG